MLFHRWWVVLLFYAVTSLHARHHPGRGVPARPLRRGGGLSRSCRRGRVQVADAVGRAPGQDHGRLRAEQSAADLVPRRAQLPDRASPVSRRSATSTTRASRASCRRCAPSSAFATPPTTGSSAPSPPTGAGFAAWADNRSSRAEAGGSPRRTRFCGGQLTHRWFLSPSSPAHPERVTPLLTDDERVDQASLGSFPASDSPPWTSGREGYAAADSEDPDGGQVFERARRRRHID